MYVASLAMGASVSANYPRRRIVNLPLNAKLDLAVVGNKFVAIVQSNDALHNMVFRTKFSDFGTARASSCSMAS